MLYQKSFTYCKNITIFVTVHMEDINKAGGVSAVMHEMVKEEMIFFLDNLTVTGETLKKRE